MVTLVTGYLDWQVSIDYNTHAVSHVDREKELLTENSYNLNQWKW